VINYYKDTDPKFGNKFGNRNSPFRAKSNLQLKRWKAEKSRH
jgi:hypothetical protein